MGHSTTRPVERPGKLHPKFEYLCPATSWDPVFFGARIANASDLPLDISRINPIVRPGWAGLGTLGTEPSASR